MSDTGMYEPDEWYDVWCNECGGYLCGGESFPYRDAKNIAHRHEDSVHGAITCIVSVEW